MLAQRVDGAGIECDHALSALRLWGLQLDLVVDAYEPLFDRQLARVEVEAAPTQAEYLSPPRAAHRRKQVGGVEAVAVDVLE